MLSQKLGSLISHFAEYRPGSFGVQFFCRHMLEVILDKATWEGIQSKPTKKGMNSNHPDTFRNDSNRAQATRK